MPARERRKRQRSASDDSIFIELRHTFGPVKKSVYKVCEFDEFGLSFLMPVSDGYFSVGTPLEYSVVNSDLSRSEGAGFVRYYSPHNDEFGTSFYKTGIEISNTYRDLLGGKHILRSERFQLSGKSFHQSLNFQNDGIEYSCELIDISRFSAAFYDPSADSTTFRVSSILNPAQILIEKSIVFEGSLTITSIYLDGSKRRRIIVEPRGRLFSIDSIERFEAMHSAVKEAKDISASHDLYKQVDPGFKSSVADLRCLLEDFKKCLESPLFQGSAESEEEKTILEEIFYPFYSKMDEKVGEMDDIVKKLNLSANQHPIYRSYYQKHLLSLLLAAPANHRSYYKPEGYPGDYEIIRMIHEDGFKGQTMFGKVLHKYTTSFPLATVARKRTEFLAGNIRDFVQSKGGQKVDVFSIASGPALEIDLLMKKHTEITNSINLTLLDREVRALQFSKDNLYSNRIQYGSMMQMNFLHSSLEDYLRECVAEKRAAVFDLVYAFGLFDYFDKDVARFLIKCLMPLVKKGGKMIISNISLDGHKYQTYAEYSFEWYLVYRSRDDMMELARGIASDKNVALNEIESGSMKFLEIAV